MIENSKLGSILREVDSMNLDGREIKLFLHLLVKVNDFGYCDESNEDLAKRMNVSERTITDTVSTLKKKGIINVVQNRHKHRRQIYVRRLGDNPKYQEEPSFEEMTEAQKKFKTLFPNRTVDCDVPATVNMDELLEEMKRSWWLMNKADNMSLRSCCIKHFKLIMSGHYRDGKFKQNNGNPLVEAAERLGVLKK